MEKQVQFETRVTARTVDRSGAIQYELRPAAGTLPRFKAGAHIDIFLPNGLIRSYSLMNSEDEADRYVCGVGLDRSSRGGSLYLHQHVREGDRLMVSAPRNLFPLVETAERSVLFAGGIGITPLIAMARRLCALGRDWRLYCCARSRDLAPFLDEIGTQGGRVVGRFDDEEKGVIDFPEALAAEPASTHFYCCGPAPMIQAYEAAAAGLPPERIHLERFSAETAPPPAGGFTVELARSRKSIRIAEGQTILEALEAEGIAVPSSCLAGICGSCVTKVLDGVPDHRDMVLTDRERGRNDQMMICCSGSLSDRLVLDR